MKGRKILLFNPKAANHGYRIPNSILQVAASVQHLYEYKIVDGNCENDPWTIIRNELSTGNYGYFGCTVMPGPQLAQAIPFSKKIHESFPGIAVIWGGYFASNQYKAVLKSGFVDFVIDGPGDYAFPKLLQALESNADLSEIESLIFLDNGEIRRNRKAALLNYDELEDLPYASLFEQYPAGNYLKKTFLGRKTAAYHSSFGCPFTCSFCAVVPIYNARWKGMSAERIYRDIKFLKDEYGADGIEFHDNNFFVNQKRTVAFSELIQPEKMNWWGEGRIDTINQYSDESLSIMREAGCRMIFFGAETGNDEVLKKMDKGGTQTGEQIMAFAERMRRFDIIPEYSFVLGLPGDSEEEVMKQIESDIAFIKQIKRVNPDTEIIIYLYSPVPTEGSELFEEVKNNGFSFPEKLEDWLNPEWQNFDLRKNPLTPWLKPYMVDHIRNFETVLNARYPTVSDFKLSDFQRKTMRNFARFRYDKSFYRFPMELKLLQKFWLKYRQPEIEGFYMESTA